MERSGYKTPAVKAGVLYPACRRFSDESEANDLPERLTDLARERVGLGQVIDVRVVRPVAGTTVGTRSG